MQPSKEQGIFNRVSGKMHSLIVIGTRYAQREIRVPIPAWDSNPGYIANFTPPQPKVVVAWPVIYRIDFRLARQPIAVNDARVAAAPAMGEGRPRSAATQTWRDSLSSLSAPPLNSATGNANDQFTKACGNIRHVDTSFHSLPPPQPRVAVPSSSVRQCVIWRGNEFTLAPICLARHHVLP
jgi:hypothetical protein